VRVALALALIAAVAAVGAEARTPRSREVPMQFQREHPCPSTGRAYGGCPGYIRDHIVPLCANGADATWNMQWQTKQAAAAKDEWERSICRHRR
jgi:hypothetical protein